MSQGANRVVNDLGKRLLEAARHGDTDEVHKLMSNGAPLTTDWLGTTPLHLASIYGHTTTAEVLIKSGINRDGRTKVDKAPLHFACQHGHIDIVKLLVTGGAHVNATDMLKMTPLHWAVEANHFEICLFLLKAGVQRDMKNKFDKTPLNIAHGKGYHSIVKLLCDEKLKLLQDMDVLQKTELLNKNVSSVKICRPENITSILGSNNNNNANNNNRTSMLKKPKTRRFPMVVGTWTGGDVQTQERMEHNDRKKIGSFKRRSNSTQPTADIITPSLGGLHLSNENTRNLVSSPASTSSENDQKSPLQQLVDAVRQSTYIEEDAREKKSSTATTTSSQENKDTIMNTGFPNNVIPVISSLALESLPPNVKAIPLGIKAESGMTFSKFSSDSKNTNSSTDKSNPELATSISPEKDTKIRRTQIGIENDEMTASVNLPVELLNQIINGDVTFHSIPTKSKESSSSSNNLIAINTEMGTIPIIPVKGGGGLQLFPIERGDDPKDFSTASSTPIVQNRGSTQTVFLPNQSPYPFPFQPQSHVSLDGNVLQSKPTTTHPVPTPMLLPTGIYLQPGHPAFFQVHRPPPISIYPPYTPRPMLTTGQMVQPTRPFLVHPGAAQPTFLQPQIPPSYVYVEREEGK